MREKRTPDEEASDRSGALVSFAQDWHQRLSNASPETMGTDAGLRLTHGLMLLRVLESRGIAHDGQLSPAINPSDYEANLVEVFAQARRRFGAVFALREEFAASVQFPEMADYIKTLYSPGTTRMLQAAPIQALGHSYEQCLAVSHHGSRKAGGVYYTPGPVVRRVVQQTVGEVLSSQSEREPLSLRVVDPACGTGAFLLGVYDRLLAAQLQYLLNAPAAEQRGRVRYRSGSPCLVEEERRRVLEECIFGVDLDEHALEVARLSLFLMMLGDGDRRQLDLFRTPEAPALDGNLTVGNSLLTQRMLSRLPAEQDCARAAIAVDWGSGFPSVGTRGFDVVIGNPPWGQKAITASDDLKQSLRDEFPTCRGIFDWFRPFVELGLRITREGGFFGMVLPDIVLLKNYEPTRKLLLDELAMTEIEWLGMAFSGATIDAVTISGKKAVTTADHRVHVVVSEPSNQLDHYIRQADFARNPRCAFNLFLTDEKRKILQRLEKAPRLGDFFEVHEGIHSGNIRSELFVDSRVDDSCRELLFGRDELRPYSLRWAGRFVRLSAIPEKRTAERYANLGRMSWYEQEKLVVRRTGDRITAAVEPHGRFASNNFFVVIPCGEHALSLYGLCALLNSSFMTWLFRTVEPRKGRAFAEVKIKHLVEFPIPGRTVGSACELLNKLGTERQRVDDQVAHELDARIDAAVLEFFDLEPKLIEASDATTLLDRRTA